MRATVKSIAKKADVSIGTVDRVLHNRPYVKAEVRSRVLAAMQELNYHPNHMASALATNTTPRRFVLIFPESESYIRQGLESGVNRFREDRVDYNLLLETWEYVRSRPEDCLDLLDQLLENRPHGVAICAADIPAARERLDALAAQRIPVVTINSDLPGAKRLCFVGEDAHRAGRLAGDLAAKFCRPGDSILVTYAGPAYEQHKARADGFLQRIDELGFSWAQCLLSVTYNDYAQTLRVVSEALEQTPDLRLIYMANWSVPACVEALRAAGKLGQVRVLCHDSAPEIGEFLRTGAVDFSIGQDLSYQSWKALNVLLDASLSKQPPRADFFHSPSPILSAENC